MARDHWDQAIKPAYVAQVRSKMKKTSLTQLDKVLQDIDQESKEVGSDTYTAFFQASQLPNHDKLNLVMDSHAGLCGQVPVPPVREVRL